MDDLLRLKKHFPDFKFTAFTIPFPREFFGENSKEFTTESYKRWAEMVKSYPWIEIAFHGFYHTHYEFDTTYEKANLQLQAAENLFEAVGLPYKKIFRAPYWQYSYDALNALKDRGYVVALDRNNPIPVPKGLKTYMYNWSFEEPLPKKDIILGHGHMNATNVTNAIGMCLENITKVIPENSRFGFVSELYEEGNKEKEN